MGLFKSTVEFAARVVGERKTSTANTRGQKTHTIFFVTHVLIFEVFELKKYG